MNEKTIQYYRNLIKLTQSDILRKEDEIEGRQLCDVMAQRKEIHSLEILIQNMESKINKLK